MANDEKLAFYDSHNIGLGINIIDLFKAGKNFYPKSNINLLYK